MTTDRNNPEAIRQDLQRWRDMHKRDIDQEALRELIDDAEKRLAQIEGRTEAH